MAKMMRLITRTLSTANSGLVYRNATANINPGLAYRNATAKDIDILTQRTVSEGWHVGPYDYSCAYQFDPKGFFVGEVDGEVASQIAIISYPNNSSFIGAHIVDDKFRGYGIATKDVSVCHDACKDSHTIGSDVGNELHSLAKKLGYKTVWDSYVATVNLENVVKNLNKVILSSSVAVKSIRDVKINKVLEYDQQVFGTARHTFIERWISAPGNFGWAAVNEKDDVIGYAVVKQVIRGAGTELGLAMAPLFADDAHIAKHLLKTAAEYCLANEAVPNTKMELFHPVGDDCGVDAPLLMNEVEAELTHIGYRMYSNGLPCGRQVKKIYGIASPSFD